MGRRFLLSVLALGLLPGCSEKPPEPRESPEWFVDRAKETGIDFVHVNGMSGKFYLAEIMAPGVGLLDFDNDGDLDLYLVQGSGLPPPPGSGEARRPPSPAEAGSGESRRSDSGGGSASREGGRAQASGLTEASGPRAQGSGSEDRLYRNDLMVAPDGARTLRFTDVTRESGLATAGYGMGVATGDIDNDGWTDIYLTKYAAPNQLFRNNGNGTFTDISRKSGTDQQSWSVSASFADVNRDGWLDLYVANYLQYTLEDVSPCFGASGSPGYCTPDGYQALPDRLYVNRRDGTFADVSVTSGVTRGRGPGLGVATADFNGDGWIDIYVANDGQENQLWMNRRDGTFEDAALLSGVALPVTGKAEASMGVDAGDADDDGDEDLFMTELSGEGSNLFVNDGSGSFDDRSAPSGVGPASIALTGFGTAWIDFDNDGRLDLLSVNGTVQIIESLRQRGDPFPLHQRKLLLRNADGGRFEDVSARAGAAFALSEVGRGAAFGDIDNDGDVDVLVGNNNGPARLLLNQLPRRHWIGLRLVGPNGRDMLGARVDIARKGAPSLWRRARADGSYASANDPRIVAGLGDSAEAPDVRVTWPDGKSETWTSVAIDRYTTLTQGSGK
jgi:hypothetical protein